MLSVNLYGIKYLAFWMRQNTLGTRVMPSGLCYSIIPSVIACKILYFYIKYGYRFIDWLSLANFILEKTPPLEMPSENAPVVYSFMLCLNA